MSRIGKQKIEIPEGVIIEVKDGSVKVRGPKGELIRKLNDLVNVVVQDGETAIVAGLIRKIESNVESGVPVLMDIPLLGALFKHTSKTKDHRELVVFVTPHIVTDEYIRRTTLTTDSEVEIKPEALADF